MMINRSEIGKNRDRKKQRRGCPTTSQGDFSWNLKKKKKKKKHEDDNSRSKRNYGLETMGFNWGLLNGICSGGHSV